MSPEDKQRLLQMLMQGQKSGAIVVEGKDQPAAATVQACNRSQIAPPWEYAGPSAAQVEGGGTLAVHSPAGRGTTLRVNLPTSTRA